MSYKPDDVGEIAVWTLDGRFVCKAARNEQLNRKLPSEALRAAMKDKSRAKRALKQARTAGLTHLHDPVDLAIAGLVQDSDRRRLPDDPDGGKATLVPVQPAIEIPQEIPPMRKAVGAEEVDLNTRLSEFNARSKGALNKRGTSIWSRVQRFVEAEKKS